MPVPFLQSPEMHWEKTACESKVKKARIASCFIGVVNLQVKLDDGWCGIDESFCITSFCGGKLLPREKSALT